MDYLPYMRTNRGITILCHAISVDLAQYKIFVLKFAISAKDGIYNDNFLESFRSGSALFYTSFRKHPLTCKSRLAEE